MDTKLQNALKKANLEVEKAGITDPEIKKIAFSKAVDFYLGGKNESSGVKSSHVGHTQESHAQIVEGFWENLTRSLGIEHSGLKDLYALKGNQVTLAIRVIPGEAKSDRQRNLAALILLAYQEGLGEEWVSSTLLAEAAKQSGLYDTSKFSGNLKSDWFRSTGAKKGLKYRLSGQGIGHAKELLTSLTPQ